MTSKTTITLDEVLELVSLMDARLERPTTLSNDDWQRFTELRVKYNHYKSRYAPFKQRQTLMDYMTHGVDNRG